MPKFLSPYDDTEEANLLSEINVTPMVDVMLVLLVIFMVAAPLMTSGLQVELPKGRQTKVMKKNPIVLTLTKEKTIFVGQNDKPISKVRLKDLLAQKTRGLKKKLLYLKADKNLSYGEVMALINDVGRWGYKLALVNQVEGQPQKKA